MIDKPMSDVRLIERWLPIAALGEESVRERRSMTALPAIYYLHVWWARRPLVASRAAILASLLPGDADQARFMSVLGINGDPVKAKRAIDRANKVGERLGANPYGYPRAFTYLPTQQDRDWIAQATGVGTAGRLSVVDPTAGGGSIPIEATRMGLSTYANDLNPVSALLLWAQLNGPFRYGHALIESFQTVSERFLARATEKLKAVQLPPVENERVLGFVWARTIRCPYCSGVIPLSPHWRLAPDGVGLNLRPRKGTAGSPRVCEPVVVTKATDQSEGTIADGDALCPYDDCRRIVDGDEVKSQAKAGDMGEQLVAVSIKLAILSKTKSGNSKEKWARSFRTPTPEEQRFTESEALMDERGPLWSALNIIPYEEIDQLSNYERGHRMYGINRWSDFFAPRQLASLGLLVETFREMVEEYGGSDNLSDINRCTFVFLALSIDKIVNFNCRQTRWGDNLQRIVAKFDRHNYAMVWSYAELPLTGCGDGLLWAVNQTRTCIKELCDLAFPSPKDPTLFDKAIGRRERPPVFVTCKSGDSLDHIESASIDAIVVDPPYGANVMYAELSDFFYVWLKRTAGLVLPQYFSRLLADKEKEAVANRARFAGSDGPEALANRDYQEKMAAIFAESRRVLKPNGIMTVMFTHKETSAWDALTKGLIEAGFIITASWPVNTEAEGSLHIKDKAAANSTIFLVCRPRPAEQIGDMTYWEDVEPLVAKAVRTRIEEFQKAGISGVDLYLASFGPALEEFSRHWPLKRGTPRPEPLAKKRRKQAELFEEEFDPYAVTPEDALDAARREVKTWRLNQLTHTKGRGDLDAITSWFVLAWDAFNAPVFSYDEGLRLARAVGADLDGQLIGKICEKKGSDIKLWDSATRAAKNALGPADGSRAMIDAIHHAAHRGRTRTLEAALELLKDAGIDSDPQFLAALEAVLEVLPPSRNFVGFDVATGEAKSAADDFDALEKLRRLAFADRVDEPQQLLLFVEEAA